MRDHRAALEQKYKTTLKSAKALIDIPRTQNREMSPEEKATYQKLLASAHEIHAELCEEEKRLERERVPDSEMMPDENALFSERAVGMRHVNVGRRGEGERTLTPGRAGMKKSYSALFGQSPACEFASLGEYLRAVHLSGHAFDPRLMATAQNEKYPSDGGWLVPEVLAGQILSDALEQAFIMRLCQVWPMTSATLKVPSTDDFDHSSGVLYGGVAAQWVDELGEISPVNVKFRLIELHAQKFALTCQTSNEILDDSPTFESVLGAKLTAAASWHIQHALMWGAGTNQPLGFLNSGNKALIEVPKESTQAGGSKSFVLENATNMFAAISPSNRRNAVWIVNDGLIPQLYAMAHRIWNVDGDEIVGGVSNGTPIFQMTGANEGTLLGKPLYFSEHASVPGTVGDVCLVDLSFYIVGLKKELTLAQSQGPGFATDSNWYRLITRLDGQPGTSKTQKNLQGQEQSPFITLAAR